MLRPDFIRLPSVAILLVTLASGCAGSQAEASSPDASRLSEPAESRSSGLGAGHGVDVGMEYEDKAEEVPERRERTPPPTRSYKPAGKSKPVATD